MMQLSECLGTLVWDYLCVEAIPANTVGAEVSQFVMHGLNCKKSVGCRHHHSAVNDIIHRALVASTCSILQVCIVT